MIWRNLDLWYDKSTYMPSKKITAKPVSSKSKTTKPVKAISTNFPDLMTGYKAAWEILPKVALKYLGLFLLFYFSIFVVILTVGGLFFAGNIGNIAQLSQGGDFSALPQVGGSMLVMAGVAIVAVMTLMILIGTLFSVAQVLLFQAAYEKREFGFGEALQTGLKLFWPMLVLGLVTFLLVMGSSLFFIIPGIVVGILLSFSYYALVIDNHRGMSALKESVRLVSGSFWSLAGRWALIILAMIVIDVILQQIGVGQGLLRILISFAQTLFVSSYVLVLYHQAKAANVGKPQPSLTWMIVVAALGWLIVSAVGVAITTTIAQHPEWRDSVKQSVTRGLEESANQEANWDSTYEFDSTQLDATDFDSSDFSEEDFNAFFEGLDEANMPVEQMPQSSGANSSDSLYAPN